MAATALHSDGHLTQAPRAASAQGLFIVCPALRIRPGALAKGGDAVEPFSSHRPLNLRPPLALSYPHGYFFVCRALCQCQGACIYATPLAVVDKGLILSGLCG